MFYNTANVWCALRLIFNGQHFKFSDPTAITVWIQNSVASYVILLNGKYQKVEIFAIAILVKDVAFFP